MENNRTFICQEFIDAIAIDPELLGQEVPIDVEGYSSFKLLFPNVERLTDNPKKYVVNYDSHILLDSNMRSTWGCVKQGKNDWMEISDLTPYLFGIVLEVIPECDLPEDLAHWDFVDRISDCTRNVLKSLYSLYPDVYRRKENYFADSISDVKYVRPDRRNPRCYMDFHSYNEFPVGSVKKQQLIEVLCNAKKKLNEHYDLLFLSLRARFQKDFRSSLLYCAMVVEMTLRRIADKCLLERNVGQDLMTYIYKRANGFSQYKELLGNLGVIVCAGKGINELMERRNRIMHGGYSPSYEEAKESYNATRDFLEFNNVPLYSD